MKRKKKKADQHTPNAFGHSSIHQLFLVVKISVDKDQL